MNENDLDQDFKDLMIMMGSVKLFSTQKDIAEVMEGIIKLSCDYFHVKKGYTKKNGMYEVNPDYELLMVWISYHTFFRYDGKSWVETEFYKAKQKFG